MSEVRNSWNPDQFRTSRGTFYGLILCKKKGERLLRSRALLNSEIGDRIVVAKVVYEVTQWWRTGDGSPIVRLARFE